MCRQAQLRPLSLATTGLAVLLFGACAGSMPQPVPDTSDAIAFNGARVIIGDGTVIESGTIVVENDRLVAVGEMDTVDIPAGASQVDLSGRTVMPAIVDTHVHLRTTTRDELVEDLQRKAYYGVAAVMSLGRGTGDLPFQMRNEVVTNAALYRTVGRGITAPEPGRTEVPYWISTTQEARAAVQELAPQSLELIKIWVDDRNGQFDKLSPDLYEAVIDEAHQRNLSVTAHVYSLEDAKGLLRSGLDAFAHGIRDTDVDDEVVRLFRERPDVVLAANLPSPGVASDLSWLSGTIPPDQLEQIQARFVENPDA